MDETPTPEVKPTPPAKQPEAKPTVVEFANAEEIRKAKEHLVEIETYYQTFAGKKTYNPFFYLSQTIAPLILAINNPKIMKSTISEILALKKDESLAKADKYVEKMVDYASMAVLKPGTTKPATLKVK